MSDRELIEWLRHTNVVIVSTAGLQGTPCFRDDRQRYFLPDNKLYGDDAVPIRWQIGKNPNWVQSPWIEWVPVSILRTWHIIQMERT